MTNYNYLIIGGGMTAGAGVDGIREVDANGRIGMISTEPDAPYNRPPLSKALWKGKPLDSIWRKTENKGVEMHLGRVVKWIVPNEKRVVDDKGDVFTYEKLLLSTGGRPRRLAFDDDQIIYFRTLSQCLIRFYSGHWLANIFWSKTGFCVALSVEALEKF